MGDFIGDKFDQDQINKDQEVEKCDFDTDVSDIKADGQRLGLPVFDVDDKDFYQNFNYGRRRLRFSSGSKAQQYMAKTRYNRPFWIQHTKSGELRKVK